MSAIIIPQWIFEYIHQEIREKKSKYRPKKKLITFRYFLHDPAKRKEPLQSSFTVAFQTSPEKKRSERERNKLCFGEQHILFWAKVPPTISECHQSISAGTRRLVVKWLFIVGAETRKPLVLGESVYFIPSACVCDCFESQPNKGDSSLGFILGTSLI